MTYQLFEQQTQQHMLDRTLRNVDRMIAHRDTTPPRSKARTIAEHVLQQERNEALRLGNLIERGRA